MICCIHEPYITLILGAIPTYIKEVDMVTQGNSFSQSGGRRNMSRKLMKKSKGGESGGESYGQDGYSEYQDGSAASHMSFLRFE
ncbi:hypothetical protein Tco_1099413 [Tanacetum coccineum]